MKTNAKKSPQQPSIVITNWETEDVCLFSPNAGPQPCQSRIGAYRTDRLSLRDDGPADNVTDIPTPEWLRSMLHKAFEHGVECQRATMRRTLGL